MKTDKSSNFRKLIEPLCHHHATRTVFDAFVKLSACCLAAQTREPEYLEEAKRWKKDELSAFGSALGALIMEMEAKPYEDVLGCYYMEYALSSKGAQWNGEFHTPKSICDLMAGLTVGDLSGLPATGPITVCEPACGAGAMLLSFAEALPPEARPRLIVTAMDINKTACDMCFINTSLWHIPTRIHHGNTLSMEFWASWTNLPLMLSPYRNYRPGAGDPVTTQGQPPVFLELEQIKTAVNHHQPELAFV